MALFLGLKSRTDDAFLLRFLRARKFDYDRAYALLINYFSVRTQNPDVFQNLSFSGVELILSKGVLSVLPQRDKDGCNIIYFRPGMYSDTCIVQLKC
jgi:alpha-tocopherol transfer protein